MGRIISFVPAPTAATEDGGILMQFPTVVFSETVEVTAGENIEVGECLALDFAAISTLISTNGIAKTAAVAGQVAARLPIVLITDAVATGAKAFIGVAAQTVVSGAKLRMYVRGYCPFVQTAGAVANGDWLTPVVAGELIKHAAGTHTSAAVVAIALSDDADIGSAPDEVGCAAWLYDTGGDLLG